MRAAATGRWPMRGIRIGEASHQGLAEPGQFLHSTQFFWRLRLSLLFSCGFCATRHPRHVLILVEAVHRRPAALLGKGHGEARPHGTASKQLEPGSTERRTDGEQGRQNHSSNMRPKRTQRKTTQNLFRISLVALQLAFAKASFWRVAQIPRGQARTRRGHTRPCI